ncbi:Hypothetical protein A7982_02154 [Minicystis rosea]|nr:Hypothetical protein A7982_02154 [Minicystis rosea]
MRNAAALALSDMKEPRAFAALVALLRDERTQGNRGTLLYALGEYDCASILALLVDFVIDGDFEVSRQALSLIHGIGAEMDEHTWTSNESKLREALASASAERRPLLEDALALFEQ